MAKEVFSICFMCTVRCPIRVLVENDDVKWIEGNPHVAGHRRGPVRQRLRRDWPCSTTRNGPSTP